ncbi:hypothetical protein DM02DRAFT_278217 [Periconia macrospinosa]|uniref:Uncharacterized protein n=1 Tax=Periconia macrospinosa TaxID=97972 RepID=A0A2V1D590_9PLEO|nr:hypothetical protein DM02DRAFT_278217 [Periconia macrospinosa]
MAICFSIDRCSRIAWLTCSVRGAWWRRWSLTCGHDAGGSEGQLQNYAHVSREEFPILPRMHHLSSLCRRVQKKRRLSCLRIVSGFDRIVKLTRLSNVCAERDRTRMRVKNDIEGTTKDELYIMTKFE